MKHDSREAARRAGPSATADICSLLDRISVGIICSSRKPGIRPQSLDFSPRNWPGDIGGGEAIGGIYTGIAKTDDVIDLRAQITMTSAHVERTAPRCRNECKPAPP